MHETQTKQNNPLNLLTFLPYLFGLLQENGMMEQFGDIQYGIAIFGIILSSVQESSAYLLYLSGYPHQQWITALLCSEWFGGVFRAHVPH